MLWPPWRRGRGARRGQARRDLLALKQQEDAGIDIVTDGEQSRQHFVHGFLERSTASTSPDKVEMGIRDDRYKAMVPTVTGPLAPDAAGCTRPKPGSPAPTRSRKLKFTLPGPMTIVDTIADAHYGDRVTLAMAFADVLNEEARELAADGVDVIQFDEPAFNVYMDEVADWGIAALRARDRGPDVQDRGAYLLRLRHQGQHRLEGDAGRRVAAIRGDVPGCSRGSTHRPGFAGMPQLAACRSSCCACSRARTCWWARSTSRPTRSRRRRRWPRRSPRAEYRAARTAVSLHQLRHGADAARRRGSEIARAGARCGTGQTAAGSVKSARRLAGRFEDLRTPLHQGLFSTCTGLTSLPTPLTASTHTTRPTLWAHASVREDVGVLVSQQIQPRSRRRNPKHASRQLAAASPAPAVPPASPTARAGAARPTRHRPNCSAVSSTAPQSEDLLLLRQFDAEQFLAQVLQTVICR